MEMDIDADRAEAGSWPFRVLLLLALGALTGLAIHFLTDTPQTWTSSSWRLAVASGLAGGFVSLAFSLERVRWRWSLAFAGSVGLVIGLVTWSNGPFGGWGSNEGWQIFSSLLAVTIAVPLFQSARDSGRARIDYPSLHAHGWTDSVLWCASWAFVLVSFLLLQLLAELFGLIGIRVLRDLLEEQWFIALLIGGAFGAAVGMFRQRERVLRMLQRVVTAIISVLTPVLAAGLVVFVLALPFTGLEPLWGQTKQTTPILLVCILGACLLVNATIGNAPDEEPRSLWLRHSAMALAAVMLPLGIVAAISIGKRIGQYGLTPERLWASVFVLFALAAGLLYLGALIRRRLDWPEDVRRANIALALGVCGLALFLALPILSVGAISARSQVARLESGKVSAEKFDWVALRFDFGPAGEREVARLAREANSPKARAFAARVLPLKRRYEALGVQRVAQQGSRPRIVTVLPRPVPIPTELVSLLFRATAEPLEAGLCAPRGQCLLRWQTGERTAIAMLDRCAHDPRETERYRVSVGICGVEAKLFEQGPRGWSEVPEIRERDRLLTIAEGRSERGELRAGRVEAREVTVRQIFVGGRPVRGALERAGTFPQPPSK
jgi:hypothetical protein